MAIEFDILGGFLDPKSLADFDKLDQKIQKSAAEMDKLIGKMGQLGMGNDYSKDAANLSVAAAKAEAIRRESEAKMAQMAEESAKRIELTEARKQRAMQATTNTRSSALTQEKLDAQVKAQISKLQMTLTSSETSSLQKLDAQIKLNVLSAQKYVAMMDTQNPKYLQLISDTKGLSEGYDRLSKAAGANMVKTNSMYGATFSLTQVMRELPNFAIDARIGFMALSNNLPALAENFQRLAKDIDVVTGKEKGFKGAFAEFGKSLLSLNTIMIVLTTAMVLWGDELTKWISGLFEAADATANFTKSQKALLDVMTEQKGAAMSTIESITKLGSQIRVYGDDTTKAKQIVKDFNKEFGTHLTTMAEVKAMYPEMAKAAIDSAIKMQAAMNLIAQGASQMLREQKEDLVLRQFSPEKVKEAEARVDTFFTGFRKLLKDRGVTEDEIVKTTNKFAEDVKNGTFANYDLSKEGFGVFNKFAVSWRADFKKNAPELFNTIVSFSDEAGKKMFAAILNKRASRVQGQLLRNAIDELIQPNQNEEDKGAGGRAKKTFSEILVAQEFYDHERAMLIEKMAELEDDISKTTIKGELNGYEQRTTAAELYYETLKRLAMSDRDVAIATANEKLAHEKKVIKDKYDDNVRKFGANSPEAAKSATELEAGNATLDQNNFNDRLKIRDEYDKKVLDGTRKQASQLYTIQQDMYADEVYLLERAQAKKLNALGIESNAQKAKTSTKSGIEMINSTLGGTSNNKLQEIRDAEDLAKKKLEIERNLIRDELALATTSGEKREELRRKLTENEVAVTELRAKTTQEIELENLSIVEDAKANVISKSIDVLKSLWDSYYQYQADKLDATLDKQTKINNESVKQYEDETDAGMHSAKELSDFKDRTAAYQASQDEENSRKKKELAKQEFLEKQAFAVAEIWINYAINVAKEGVNLVAQGWLLASAIASTALVAAQTIPAFAEGGVMDKDGKALIGDGGKNELIMTPTGDWYVSPKVPTVVDMQAGTKIFPDINKLDLNSFLAMAQVQPQMLKTDNLEKELKELNRNVRNQKQGNFYGMPLIRQLNNSSRYSARKRGLMN